MLVWFGSAVLETAEDEDDDVRIDRVAVTITGCPFCSSWRVVSSLSSSRSKSDCSFPPTISSFFATAGGVQGGVSSSVVRFLWVALHPAVAPGTPSRDRGARVVVVVVDVAVVANGTAVAASAGVGRPIIVEGEDAVAILAALPSNNEDDEEEAAIEEVMEMVGAVIVERHCCWLLSLFELIFCFWFVLTC